MAAEQKYDVIHYIREAYLKPYHPGQYGRVDPAYLARLPKGTSRGAEPVEIQPWVTMDYGPSLMASYEISNGDGSNIVNKGIAIRLDSGPGGVSRGRAWALYVPNLVDQADHRLWLGPPPLRTIARDHGRQPLGRRAHRLSQDPRYPADPVYGDHVPHPGQGRRDGGRGDSQHDPQAWRCRGER